MASPTYVSWTDNFAMSRRLVQPAVTTTEVNAAEPLLQLPVVRPQVSAKLAAPTKEQRALLLGHYPITAIKLDEARRKPVPASKRRPITQDIPSAGAHLNSFTIEELGRMLSSGDDDLSGDGSLDLNQPLPEGLVRKAADDFTLTVHVRFLALLCLAVALGLGFASIMVPFWPLAAAAAIVFVASPLFWHTTTASFEPLVPGRSRKSRRIVVTHYSRLLGKLCARTTECRAGDVAEVVQVRCRSAAPGQICLFACGKRGTGGSSFALYNGSDHLVQRERWLAFLGLPDAAPDYYLV